MTNPHPAPIRHRLIHVFAVLSLLAVMVLPLFRVSPPLVASAAQTGECLGYTNTQGTKFTTRALRWTSDVSNGGVLHVIGCGETFTLTDIKNAAGSGINGAEPTDFLQLIDPVNKVWMLNVNLTVEEGATLNLIGVSGDVNWLRLKSQGTLASIIWLKTINGTLRIENTRISSWDPTTGTTDWTNEGPPTAPETGG